ncbi:Uncharacterized protein TPAR_08587 [Tolypocladium paradoxum]|uniref:Uncharacterized protein n=1 Tax=Tolypocladium paradoxum TaxID=94208 RepID=A0A2S4KLZ1_9HYPO|nr:Uncharacterized protein TPAR_08587 [Tolypocladium paradoxum]
MGPLFTPKPRRAASRIGARPHPGRLSRVPTADKVHDVLEPRRPQKLRRMPSTGTASWLTSSTSCAPPAEASPKMTRSCAPGSTTLLLPPASRLGPDDECWMVLDDTCPDRIDRVLCDEADVQQAYDVLPELAAPNKRRDRQVRELSPTDEDNYEESILSYAAVGSMIPVIDQEAFETNEPWLRFALPRATWSRTR